MYCRSSQIQLLVLLFLIFNLAQSQTMSYMWPIWPNPSPKEIWSGFCAFRPYYEIDNQPMESHLHGGNDLPESSSMLGTVFSVSHSFKVIQKGGQGENLWI